MTTWKMQIKLTWSKYKHRQEEKYTKLHEGERNPHINFPKNIKTTHKVEHMQEQINVEHNL